MTKWRLKFEVYIYIRKVHPEKKLIRVFHQGARVHLCALRIINYIHLSYPIIFNFFRIIYPPESVIKNAIRIHNNTRSPSSQVM